MRHEELKINVKLMVTVNVNEDLGKSEKNLQKICNNVFNMPILILIISYFIVFYKLKEKYFKLILYTPITKIYFLSNSTPQLRQLAFKSLFFPFFFFPQSEHSDSSF